MKSLIKFISIFAVFYFVSCASKKIMKDCESKGNGFYECEEP